MHEGTNPRCRHSTLGELCVFDYHCRDDLVCGKYFNCCSPFWKMCIKNEDCCDKSLVCRSADGFIYDRCLKPSAAQPPVRAVPRTILGALVIVSVLAHRWRWLSPVSLSRSQKMPDDFCLVCFWAVSKAQKTWLISITCLVMKRLFLLLVSRLC